MKLSCTDAMVPGKTLTEKAQRLKRWGYDGIAVFMDYSTWSPALLEEIEALEERTGIVPCEFVFSAECYGALMCEDGRQRAQARRMYAEAVAVCARIGAVTELEYQYGPQDPLPLFAPYARMRPDQQAEFLEMYRELAVPLEATRGYLLLENINRYESPYLNSLAHCIGALEALDAPHTGLLADLFHMSIEEADLPGSLRAAGGWIRHVHLGDSNRLEPGKGHTDWTACMKALRDVDYGGFLNLECGLSEAAERALPRTAVYLRSLM